MWASPDRHFLCQETCICLETSTFCWSYSSSVGELAKWNPQQATPLPNTTVPTPRRDAEHQPLSMEWNRPCAVGQKNPRQTTDPWSMQTEPLAKWRASNTDCEELDVCVPQNSYVKIQSPLRWGGASGKKLSHESGAFINGISVFLMRPENSMAPYAMWGHSGNMAAYEPGNGCHDQTSNLLVLWSWASQPPEQWAVSWVSHPGHSLIVLAAWAD